MGETHADIQKHVRTYMFVFAALAGLTIITVAVSYLHLPFLAGVILAMVIASVKGFLVAGYFMHLLDEKKAIYWVLGVTVFMFAVLMSLPAIDETLGWNMLPHQPGPGHAASAHGGEGASH